ncbi:MAG: hypothetical protein JNL10_21165, partial [Verrucomicrobiales bacterium]|nr:hypothetical protein [Verrucomicrobiales bacterium]
RVMARTNVVLEFSAATVGATVGANTVEIVRTGPAVANYSYWIQTDYLKLESLAAVSPAVTTSASPSKRASATASVQAESLPVAAASGVGTAARIQATEGMPHYGTRIEGGLTYLTLTFGYPAADSPDSRSIVEGSSDGVHWTQSTVTEESRVEASGWITITDRDLIPMNQVPSRRLRLRNVSLEASGLLDDGEPSPGPR